ncbi:uncharacterized protein VP01_1835g1 [Puccinia sorghi]|uniref:DDE Tnp4 domain-containing protein n=1 Tax=Puccinia sorghi TaxID=27349 RepID=A0A0L6VDX2_9BASI|nr:uncharacterized protein VP01_1835g1 [Puccinia sorghi]
MELSSVETMKRIRHWLSVCVVLHNLLLNNPSPEINHDSVDITTPIDNNNLPR